MMKFAIFGLLALIAVCSAVELREKEFMQWRIAHERFYADAEEHSHRLEVFSHNMEKADKHNAMNLSFKMGATRWADLTNDEYRTMLSSGGFASSKEGGSTFIGTDGDLPDTVDWRDEGAVTPVKDQGQCGSCWSFSTTGGLEGAWKLAGHDLVSLSEQNLMDCSWSHGNDGCDGGLVDQALDYVIANGGVDTEESYPYEERSSFSCKFNATNVGATCSSYVHVTKYDETALQGASATQGPVSIAIDASHTSFQLYTSGVYYEKNCHHKKDRLDHAVLLVGYGTDADSGSDYWLVKNSWNVTWGEEGYIRMSRNRDNNCGVATAAYYPVIEA